MAALGVGRKLGASFVSSVSFGLAASKSFGFVVFMSFVVPTVPFLFGSMSTAASKSFGFVAFMSFVTNGSFFFFNSVL